MDIAFEKINRLFVLYKQAWVAGKHYRISRGKWNFYIHELGLKVPYVNGVFLDCRSRATPKRTHLAKGKLNHTDLGRYHVDDWIDVLFKPVKRRIIENYIAAKRLHAAGLGPSTRGICYIKNYMVLGRNWLPIETYGLMIDDVFALPPKPNATKEEILAAGVKLDKIGSCWRQQENGYVVDLNSVCGVMPVNCENEVSEIEKRLNQETGSFYANP